MLCVTISEPVEVNAKEETGGVEGVLTVTISGTKILCAGQPPDQLTGIMNEYREVLRTDPKTLPTVLNGNEGSNIGAALAR